MKYDLFDLFDPEMPWYSRAWRLAFLAGLLGVVIMDVFVWRT